MPPLEHLCDPVDEPEQLHDPFFQFYSTKSTSYCKIRAFCTTRDIELLADWVSQLSGGVGLSKQAIAIMKKEHAGWLRSREAQSVMCIVDGFPLLQIDVHKTNAHNTMVAVSDVKEYDYSIDLLFPSDRQKIREKDIDRMVVAMEGFVEFVRGFPEVKRLFCKIDVNDDIGQKIIFSNGFRNVGIVESYPAPIVVHGLVMDDTIGLPPAKK